MFLQLMVTHDVVTSGVSESSVRGRLCLRLSYDACARTLTVCVIAARELSVAAVQQTTTTTNGGKLVRGSDSDKRPSVYVKIAALPRRS